MLAVFAGGLLLLHPGVLGHVDAGRSEAVGHVHGVAGPGRRVLGAHGRRPVGQIAGQMRQRGHELRHGGLTVDEAGLIAAAGFERQARVRGPSRGQPEASPGALRRRGPRFYRYELVVLQVSRRHPGRMSNSHRNRTSHSCTANYKGAHGPTKKTGRPRSNRGARNSHQETFVACTVAVTVSDGCFCFFPIQEDDGRSRGRVRANRGRLNPLRRGGAPVRVREAGPELA